MQIVISHVKIGQIRRNALEKGQYSWYNLQKETGHHKMLCIRFCQIRKNEMRSGAFIFIKHTIAKRAAIRQPVLHVAHTSRFPA